MRQVYQGYIASMVCLLNVLWLHCNGEYCGIRASILDGNNITIFPQNWIHESKLHLCTREHDDMWNVRWAPAGSSTQMQVNTKKHLIMPHCCHRLTTNESPKGALMPVLSFETGFRFILFPKKGQHVDYIACPQSGFIYFYFFTHSLITLK